MYDYENLIIPTPGDIIVLGKDISAYVGFETGKVLGVHVRLGSEDETGFFVTIDSKDPYSPDGPMIEVNCYYIESIASRSGIRSRKMNIYRDTRWNDRLSYSRRLRSDTPKSFRIVEHILDVLSKSDMQLFNMINVFDMSSYYHRVGYGLKRNYNPTHEIWDYTVANKKKFKKWVEKNCLKFTRSMF
ncbi:MAG: hypothetical protein GY804_08565 [Alphaproteobacteria bacterium]|nr:hypothetical protein [Alphaproteobacteria bacterium]